MTEISPCTYKKHFLLLLVCVSVTMICMCMSVGELQGQKTTFGSQFFPPVTGSKDQNSGQQAYATSIAGPSLIL